jgi:hypothetical protein
MVSGIESCGRPWSKTGGNSPRNLEKEVCQRRNQQRGVRGKEEGFNLILENRVKLGKENFMIEKGTAKGKRKKSTSKKKDLDSRAVEITFYAPQAREVFLAGEFNHWDIRSLPMTKDEGGIWKQKIELTPGHYEYKIFVDGTWFEDIKGPETVSNSFGTHNFVLDIR